MKASTIALLGGAGYLYMQQQKDQGNGSGKGSGKGTLEYAGSLPPDDEPQYSDDVEKLLGELIEQGDAAKSDTGVVAAPGSEANDRHALAVVECKRAIRDYDVPQSELSACVATVESGDVYEYYEPGWRYVIEVDI